MANCIDLFNKGTECTPFIVNNGGRDVNFVDNHVTILFPELDDGVEKFGAEDNSNGNRCEDDSHPIL